MSAKSPGPTAALPEPPQDLIELVGSLTLDGFRRVGEEFLGYFRDLCDVRPDEHVLEVGSGSGRIAAPLLGYLDERGSYDGFDVAPDAVAWCEEHLAPANPRFRFHHADIQNAVYNPEGALVAEEYTFPFPDASFDFVFLTSVFTHVLPGTVTHYLEEIARVVRPGGRVLSTWFLLDDWSREAARERRSQISFVPRAEPWWVMDPVREEWAVAYDERLVRSFLADAGLGMDRVLYGTWSDRAGGVSFQDLVLSSRTDSPIRRSAMMAAVGAQYELEPNLTEGASPARQLALVGGNKRVLEFGCGYGYMSREMTARGCRVTAIEVDPVAAKRAEEHCERVLVRDLDTIDLDDALDGERYEVAMFGDVLEHLKDPRFVLRQVKDVLVPGGYVVASIPNVAHGAVRLSLLRGSFEYRKIGLLDETHLHMFTKDSIESLFRDAGLVVSEMQEISVDFFMTEIPLRREDFDPDLVERLEQEPHATTYQYVVKAVVDDASGAIEELRRRTEALQGELVAVGREREHETARADEVTRWAEHLIGELRTAEDERDRLRAEKARLERLLPVRGYRALSRRLPRR